MAFLTEPEPVRGTPTTVAEGIRRLVARNPSSMTNHGTNTYLMDTPEGLVIVDPGPDTDPQHLDDIEAAISGPVAGLLITHGHQDHVGAAAEMQARLGVPTYGYPDSLSPDFKPDVPLRHGDTAFGMEALHTPGHAPDHLCFARPDGLVFTGDHVMAWSSSVVSPPNGSMSDYVDTLQMLIERGDRVYLPGHGPALPDPVPYVTELRRRRIAREEEILALLKNKTMSVTEIGQTLYHKLDPVLQSAAERNVLSHLEKLWTEGRVAEDDSGWSAIKT